MDEIFVSRLVEVAGAFASLCSLRARDRARATKFTDSCSQGNAKENWVLNSHLQRSHNFHEVHLQGATEGAGRLNTASAVITCHIKLPKEELRSTSLEREDRSVDPRVGTGHLPPAYRLIDVSHVARLDRAPTVHV